MNARWSTGLLLATMLVCLTMAGSAVAGPPPPPARTLPGAMIGNIESRWLAPYVRVTNERVGTTGITTVRWFDESGKVVRELAGPGLDAHGGYLTEYADGRSTIHAVTGDWKFVLPKKPGSPGYITATADGRTFLHQFHPREGQIAVDVYHGGKLAGTIGPLLQYRGRDVQLAPDGSLALLAWNTRKKQGVQLVVAGPDGKLRFKVGCQDSVESPLAAPGGNGVLARLVSEKEPPVVFRFYQAGGKRSTFAAGPNAFVAAWAPQTTMALFSTSIGDKYRHKLINCAAGETIWDIPEPVRHYPSTGCSVMVVKEYVLFAGIDFAAVDVKDGRVVARWRPNASRSTAPWFARLGKRLFVVAHDEFSEISLADIAAGKNGWK